MLKYENVRFVDLYDWDKLVEETYGRPYSFQQQDGCKDRGHFRISIPNKYTEDEEMNDSIPEEVNGNEMGVKFKAWLARDPNQPLSNPEDQYDWSLRLFWERNFYPDIYTIANDLYNKGLIEAGEYIININW